MVGVDKVLPISTAQAGMWISEKAAAADVTFNLAEYLEIHGPICPGNFRSALRQLTREVEATRLRIREIDGQPHQVVLSEYPGDFAVLDFAGADDPRRAAEAWMVEDLLRPVDLAHDNLWTGALLKVAPDRWFWHHRVHHIAYDGFAGGLVARRLAELYSALQEGRPAAACDFGSLDELLEAERGYRSSPHFERDRAFWREALTALPPPVSLAKHRTTPVGGLLRHSSFIEAAKVKKLEALARSLGASLPQALIALVAAYYAQATDCEDLVIATMVTSRMNDAMRRIPAMMANAAPLRFDITADLSWQDLIKQVSQHMMRALRRQRYRIEDMRRDLGLVRPDEQIAWLGVNIEPFDYDLRFDGHRTTAHNLSNGTMNDFTIFAYDRGDGRDLRIDFDANAALYSRAELADHEARFTRLMDEIVAAPDRPLREIDLLSASERRLVLTNWNDTARDVADKTWPQLFREQAARHPDAVAVVFGDRELSYGELDAASDQWADVLIDKGVAAGDLVAVAVPRSEQMVVALLAVLKAGAAYLPLDPADPAARVAMILEDAQPAAVITTSEGAEALPRRGPRQVLMDRRPEAPRTCRSVRVSAAQDIAYVIFTSGSTGRPKGVQIPHQALTNFLCAMQDLLQLKPHDRLLAVTTISFDIAGLELFLPLLVGARTVIASREVVREPAALCQLIRRSGATVMQATPSLWRALLADHTEPLQGLRPLVGGEALPPDLARRMAALGHPVWNLYGPTETTVWSTATPLAGADLAAPPIGRPIWNTRVYVLDRHLRPVPPGFPGELFIGGRGLANGYLNRPDLTAERFLPDPFAAEGGRMYRTGDLTRWRPDGALEYLGRNDHQIKIRGFRIEPGEIEAALVAQPEIREAVVILREDPGRDKRLVAYLVLVDEARVDGPELSRSLSRTLPGHMIPAAYVTLETIPLNVNGKVDRRALPPPQWAVSGFVAPRTETERQIAEIWCEVLGIEEVSVHASFFELGGDSLAAVAMLSGLRSRNGGEIPLGAVFEAPTIASLAAHLESAAGGDPILDPVLTIRAKGQKPPLFCIHPVLGLGWGFHSLASHIDGDIPIYALQSEGLRDLSLLPDTIEDMAQRYLARIRQIQPTGPYHLLGWSLGGVVAHEMVRQLRESDEQIAFLGLLDSYPYNRPAKAGFQDEPSLARAALGFLGFDATKAEVAGAALTLAELGDFLFEQYDLDRHPLVQQIRQRDPAILDRARAVILHHLTLAMHFVPGRIDVDMHFFCAAQDEGASVQGVLNYRPEAWFRHIGGRIYRHRLNCGHQEMLDPGPAAEIGAEIQAEIRREVLVLRRPVVEAAALTA